MGKKSADKHEHAQTTDPGTTLSKRKQTPICPETQNLEPHHPLSLLREGLDAEFLVVFVTCVKI